MESIIKIFVGAFSVVYHRRVALLKSLVLPLVFAVVLQIISYLELLGLWMFIVMPFLICLIYTLIAVNTHRVILIGEEAVSEWGSLKVTMREVRFTIYSFVVALLLLWSVVFTFIPYVGKALAFIYMAYVLGRSSLVFPAIATDQRWGLSKSWMHTQNYQLMMALVVTVFPIIVGVPWLILEDLPYTDIVLGILALPATILTISALSCAYKVVGEEEGIRIDGIGADLR